MESEVGKAKYLREKFPGLNIEVDGGIGVDNIDVFILFLNKIFLDCC